MAKKRTLALPAPMFSREDREVGEGLQSGQL